MRRKRRLVRLCGWFHSQLVVGDNVVARIHGQRTRCQVVRVFEEPGNVRVLVIEDPTTKARYPIRIQ